jgi:hypothetical protein
MFVERFSPLNSSHYVTISLLAALLFGPNSASAIQNDTQSTGCPMVGPEQRLSDTTGSIGFMANFRGTKDSIASVAKELLQRAMVRKAQFHCEAECQPRMSEVIYRVEPIAFQPRSKQRPECLQLEQDTATAPFEFGELSFTALDDLNDWIMDFSRGKGVEGKKLYRQCSSNCSPRYTFRIRGSQSTRYWITVEVLCGLARDKSNKRYALSTAIRLDCDTTSDVNY